MLYVLYGSDTYRSRAKAAEIGAAFASRAGDGLNVTRIDAGRDPGALADVGRTGSLFSAKEFVLIEELSAAGDRVLFIRDRFEPWATDKNLLVVIRDDAPKLEGAPLLARAASAATKVQEFAPLPPVRLRAWLAREATGRGVALSAADAEALLARHGADLWALANELEKIRAGWKPSLERREELKAWSFADTVLGGRARAFVELARLLQARFEGPYLVGVVAGALRRLALARNGGVRGEPPRSLHPVVAKKYTPRAQELDAVAFASRWEDLEEADRAIKTGELPPGLAAERFVLRSRSRRRA